MKNKTITIKQYEWKAFFGGVLVTVLGALGLMFPYTLGMVVCAFVGIFGFLIAATVLSSPDEYEVEVKD